MVPDDDPRDPRRQHAAALRLRRPEPDRRPRDLPLGPPLRPPGPQASVVHDAEKLKERIEFIHEQSAETLENSVTAR